MHNNELLLTDERPLLTDKSLKTVNKRLLLDDKRPMLTNKESKTVNKERLLADKKLLLVNKGPMLGDENGARTLIYKAKCDRSHRPRAASDGTVENLKKQVSHIPSVPSAIYKLKGKRGFCPAALEQRKKKDSFRTDPFGGPAYSTGRRTEICYFVEGQF